jgi:uncharacterized membrane protein YhdT
MLLLVGWIILSVFVGWAASNRGRDGFSWFLISCLISPLLGVLILIAVPPLKADTIEDETKKCPRCAEMVKAEAKVCRFCGHNFDLQARVASLEPPNIASPEPPTGIGVGLPEAITLQSADSSDQTTSSENKVASGWIWAVLLSCLFIVFFVVGGLYMMSSQRLPNSRTETCFSGGCESEPQNFWSEPQNSYQSPSPSGSKTVADYEYDECIMHKGYGGWRGSRRLA